MNDKNDMLRSDAPGPPALKLIYDVERFCSGSGMDIRGMGPSTVRRLHAAGLVSGIPNIYDLPHKLQWITALPGFGLKRADALAKAITASKHNDIHKLLFGLGAVNGNPLAARALAEHCPHMDAICRMSCRELSLIRGVGPATASALSDFCHSAEGRQLLQCLKAKGVNMESKSYGKEGKTVW